MGGFEPPVRLPHRYSTALCLVSLTSLQGPAPARTLASEIGRDYKQSSRAREIVCRRLSYERAQLV